MSGWMTYKVGIFGIFFPEYSGYSQDVCERCKEIGQDAQAERDLTSSRGSGIMLSN